MAENKIDSELGFHIKLWYGIERTTYRSKLIYIILITKFQHIYSLSTFTLSCAIKRKKITDIKSDSDDYSI